MSYNVTAVITTCRREWSIIERAIRSVSAQTRPVYELLLIDDNDPSSEFTKTIKENIKAWPIARYVSMGVNSGVAAARNKAMSEARGDLIGYLDDDDEWFPDKIEKQTAVFEAHPDAGIVYGVGMKLNDDTGKEEGYTWSYTVFRECPTFEEMLAADRIGSTSHPLIKKEVLKAVGGFQTQGIPAVEDYELWIRIIRQYKGYGLKEALYHKHMNNSEHVSRNRNKTFAGYRYIYHEFEEDYAKNLYAKKRILWNVVREGVKAKNPQVLPYFFRWLLLKWNPKAKGDLD